MLTAMIPWRLKRMLDWGKDKVNEALLPLITPRIPLPSGLAEKQIFFIGASVGQAWRLPVVFPNIKVSAIYQFDKTLEVERAIALRPDAIIVKECAAYFPSPAADRNLVLRWMSQIRAAGIRPIAATVVPVTQAHAARAPGRAEAIWGFNDWLRALSTAEKIPLLDLEAALRCSPANRYLNDHLASDDGLHLPNRTYRRCLDPLVPPLLQRTFTDEK